MKKLHIRRTKGSFVPMCGVAIKDASLQFLVDGKRMNRAAIGQSRVCGRCRVKQLKILDGKGL